MLSKSMGQILRVAAAMHVLFSLDTTELPTTTVSQAAVKAAIHFLEVCCQHEKQPSIFSKCAANILPSSLDVEKLVMTLN